MRALVLDGYTDEPACLGVPPYISPYARLAFGALAKAGAEGHYRTVDQWRDGEDDFSGFDLLAVIRRVAVPGKYLRGMPASDKELIKICGSFKGLKVASLGVDERRLSDALKGCFDHIVSEDLDAALFELVSNGALEDRRRGQEEWNSWLEAGAVISSIHPDAGGPLIAEVQMYRGCVRYISGGCKFCVEPLSGEVVFREPKDILREVAALSDAGVRNIRLGAQSCVFCYKSEDVGMSETPRPNVAAIESLLKGVKETMRPRVFHLDNANPAVIASHPEESRKILKAIVENCTSGNVLAFGLESADPKVAEANNLNASADQTIEAVRIVNELGRVVGPSGLPHVLPGINFVCGLEGESKQTYALNLQFLQKVVDEGLLLRRINIRQVVPYRADSPGVRHRKEFEKFKRDVREQIDQPMLERLLPSGSILRNVRTELREGGRTFGRQVGTYPLLVGLPYAFEIGMDIDVAIIGCGPRSVTGIANPTNANTASMAMLEAIPGIGRRRAMAIMRKRPFDDPEDLWQIFDEETALASARSYLVCGDVERS
ncbi:MAG: radical SAM protein [Candidatus Thermoplasmatota archaeon]|nr:radical SAM protein [Candidatus Thermoplasmatota archaeon]